MHRNRATSTLFSQFLVIPTELTVKMKGDGHQKLPAVLHPKSQDKADAKESRFAEIPINQLPDKIAMPTGGFFDLGYKPGDPMQFDYDGKQLVISSATRNIAELVESCEVDEAGVKIPPTWLIQAFTGAADTIDHIESGKQAADYYVDLYNRLCGDFGEVERVLDFGCGCGRVLSRMPGGGGVQYFGVDLREDALEWLRATMPEGTFVAGDAMPPVDLEPAQFDLIYAISVLTHLTQEQEGAWLDEWHRLLKPGGHVFATFRAEDWVDQFAYDNQKDGIRQAWADNEGFCYQKHDYWEGLFPEYYSGTYHTEGYVRSNWGKRFEIIELLPAAGTPNEQNMAVMRKAT